MRRVASTFVFAITLALLLPGGLTAQHEMHHMHGMSMDGG